ncbi:zinc ABC transporter substrate-binding protein AztC [Dietzia sp. PP-33]|jgi:zinc/manganese transport system substrate-binding protein|uniref:zinc ABC transporter substrate-binding protein AztC n=1 Tax=Dietzia sp. PP-33 TaxID=2957500 RepID=UPI0029A8CB71|nr:zinc ABC transporter substrate-binding protein AztC [Dietzia sp. PP-33]MDX2358371.1 zinc ABC transporter substrate-binding protein AztC [Dietzia sp. PP-33]
MRRRSLLSAALVTAGLALSGCAIVDGATNDRPTIVVTTNILGDVVENVVGEAADVTTLMKRNADPHSFEISAQEASLMDRVDLVVSNGMGLEEGLQQHLDRVAGTGVPMLVAGEHVEVIDYSEGDAGGTPDPHFWTDPARMVDVVDALEAELVEVDGIDRAAVEAGADRYREELDELDDEMAAAFATIPSENRALVTNHHVFGYLAERFDFRVLGAAIPGGTTLASPSAADLDGLASAITEAGVPAIFAESSQPDRLVQVLASEAGIDTRVIELFTESLTEPGQGAPSYLEMMRANTERIVDGLST